MATTKDGDHGQGPKADPPTDVPGQAGAADAPTLVGDARTVLDVNGGAPVVEGGVGRRPAPAVPGHELLRCIGRGSYGEVWLARNVMGTYRAVKIVYRETFQHARPFEREFNGIKKFEPISRSHEGLVDVLQVGRGEDWFYYVMEVADDVVAGQEIEPGSYAPKTLRGEVTERGRLGFERCVEVGLTLVEGLGHMHRHGLIHRDIKPSNIIFVHGVAKLADIGLVAEQSEAKSFVGTEGFIAPEGPGSPQADVYALGKVMYEMATGKDRHEFPALPTLLGEEAGGIAGRMLELNAVILKACQGDRRERYENAEGMREDLLLLRSGRSVARAQRLERRLAALTKLSVAGATLTAVVLAALVVVRNQAQREARLRGRAESSETEARQNLYAAEMNLAREKIAAGHIFEARHLLERHRRAATNATEGLDFEWRYLWGLCRDESVVTLRGHSNYVQGVAVSPDGRWLGSVGPAEAQPSLWDMGTGGESGGLSGFGVNLRAVAFSPDGRWLAAGGRDAVWVWELASKQLTFTLEGAKGQVEHIAFSNDGRWLAAGLLAGRTLTLWDLGTHQIAAAVDAMAAERMCVDFSPDSRLLAVTRGDRSVALCEVPSLKEVTRLRGHADHVVFASFAADGRSLVSTSQDGTARIWDLVSRRERVTLRGHSARVTSAAFSPRDPLVATSCMDGSIKLWDLETGHERSTLKGHSRWVNSVRFLPDGSRLVSSSDDLTVKLWDATPQPDRTVLTGHTTGVNATAFSPDGKLLASGSDDGALLIWDVPTQRQVASFPRHDRGVRSLAFSRDGALLATVEAEGKARLWNVPRRAEVQTLPQPVRDAGFIDATTLVTYGRDALVFWTRAPGGDTFREQERLTEFNCVAMDCQARRAIEIGADSVRVADLESRQAPKRIPGPTTNLVGVWFAPTGKVFATLHGQELRLWNSGGSGGVTALISNPDFVHSVAFSDDARWVATASQDNTARVWDVRNGRLVAVLRGHSGWVVDLVFSPDGRRLVTCSNDGTTKVWDLATAREVATMLGHVSPFSKPRIAPDGQALAVFSTSSAKIRLWLAPAPEDRAGP